MVVATLLMGCSTPDMTESKGLLDELFAKLHSASSADEAHNLAMVILQALEQSGRSDIDLLMLHGTTLMRRGDADGALYCFDQVVELDPDFAEGYDQRALAHAMRDEYPEAIDDIQHVLFIEPRHFAALVRLGQLLELYEQDEAALDAFEAALTVDPHLDEVREHVEDLKDKLAGLPI
jgi:tetratricopeptide (TPR) repeat protein